MNFFDETAVLSINEPTDVLVEIENIVSQDDDDCVEDDDTEDDSGIAEETDLTPIINKFPELENLDSIGDEGTNINNFLTYW